MAHGSTIQFYRGVFASLPTGRPDGEPAWATDTHQCYISQGGVNYLVGGGGSSGGPELANVVFAGPPSGAAATPTWRAIVAADLVAAPVAGELILAASTVALGQTANVRYAGGRLIERNAGPPVLADLGEGEFAFSFAPAPA